MVCGGSHSPAWLLLLLVVSFEGALLRGVGGLLAVGASFDVWVSVLLLLLLLEGLRWVTLAAAASFR
jgi:hypothetical protein